MTKKAIYVVLQEFLGLLCFYSNTQDWNFRFLSTYSNLYKIISTILSLYLYPHPEDFL